MIDFSKLHDAILIRVQLDWNTGVSEFSIKTGIKGFENISINCSKVSSIVIERKAPWGMSISINSVKIDRNSLLIEMQSGDNITVEASSIDIVEL